ACSGICRRSGRGVVRGTGNGRRRGFVRLFGDFHELVAWRHARGRGQRSSRVGSSPPSRRRVGLAAREQREYAQIVVQGTRDQRSLVIIKLLLGLVLQLLVQRLAPGRIERLRLAWRL